MTELTTNINQINTMEESKQAQAPESSWRKWTGLGVLTLGLVIVVIDTTLLNVSLSAIIKDLNTDIQSLQWVITAYALVLAAFTITGGRLGDLFGRKKMFMLGAVIFAVGSFMASIAHSIPILLIGESIIEGFGAALMMPATAALVVANFHGPDRAKAFGIWGAAAGASSAVGPLLGGYLTTHYSWRWGFRINLVVAVLVILGSLWLVKESKDDRKPTLDFLGVILSSLGLLAITFGIIESANYGWWKAKEIFSLFHHNINILNLSIVPISMAVGVILLAIFFWWEKQVEKKGKTPLVSMDLFKNRQFTSSVTTVAVLTLAMTGQIFALPIFLQSVKGLGAFDTGLALLPLSLALIVFAPLTGFLSKKIDPKYLIQFGLVVSTAAALVLRATLSADVLVSHLIPGLALYGAGLGMVFAPISNITLSAVPVNQAGEASGVNNTLRQVGATLGAAIIGAAVLTSLSASLAKGINASTIIPNSYKQQIITAVANPNSNIEFGGASNVTSQLPPAISQEIKNIANQSTAQASKDAYIYSAMFLLLGLAISLYLPKTKLSTGEEFVHTEEAFSEDPAKNIKVMASVVVVIVALGGGVWLLKRSATNIFASASTSAVSESQNDIRSLFTPPAVSETPSPVAPPSTAFVNPAPQPTPPVPSIAEPSPQIYQNSVMGFSAVLPSDWQTNNVRAETKVLFATPNGVTFSVESYSGSDMDLNVIEQQLSGSPSVNNVRQITFQGEPALIFNIQGAYKRGLAAIHNGRVYYIMTNSPSENLPGFKFL